MDHQDHINLPRGGVPAPGGVWADFGSGVGAFTLAPAELIGPSGQIHSVDRDRRALQQQERAMRGRFPATAVVYHPADFTQPLHLPPLDGVVMANAPSTFCRGRRKRMWRGKSAVSCDPTAVASIGGGRSGWRSR
jgi:hypothetical protein